MNRPFKNCLLLYIFSSTLGACEWPKACSPTQVIRVIVHGQRYDVPAEYRAVLVGQDGKTLDKYSKNGPNGRHAYCQSPSDPPADVYLSFSKMSELWIKRPQLSGVYHLTIGRHITYGSATKDDMYNSCDAPSSLKNDCRISFWSKRKILIQADVMNVPVSEWEDKVKAVRDFVQSFESI